jgi:dihydropteroate synthase
MIRKIYYWKLRESEMQLGERTLIMGVLNLTPDSFSDGGKFSDPDRAYARALELEEAGADIIDIGAESTRPGSPRISADEEWQRLVPVLKKLKGNLRVPLSLDTYKSEIAERALQYGVEIINDPSGLTFDPGIAKVAANGNVGLILNHMRGQPETWGKLPPMQDPVGTIKRDLDATINRARGAGVERNRIIIDPGLGFGKRKEQNSEILARLGELSSLDYPILVGASRKSFLAQSTEVDTEFATAAAVTAAALNGAHIVRVHDVKAMQSVLMVADEIVHAASVHSRAAMADEKPAATRTARPAIEFEEPKRKPARPPLAKPVAVAPPVVEPLDEEPVTDEVEASEPSTEPIAEHAAEAAPPAVEAPKPIFKKEYPKTEYPKKEYPRKEYPKKDFAARDDRSSARPSSNPPFKFSADREAAWQDNKSAPRRDDDRGSGGFKPPVRRTPYGSDNDRPRAGGSFDRGARPSGGSFDRGARPSGGSFDRGGRPGGGSSDRGPRPSGGSFSRGPRPGGDRFERGAPPSGDRFERGGPPSDRPAPRGKDFRPGGPRPPFRDRGDRPNSGPPRRDFKPGGRTRPGGVSGGDGPRNFPPRSGPGGFRPSGPSRGDDRPQRSGPPAKRPFRKRP